MEGLVILRSESILAEHIYFRGFNGEMIEGYLARALSLQSVGSVVVIHHMPGFDRSTKEITRRFAEMGFNAVMPNLNYREGPGASSDDAAAATRAAGGVPDDRLIGDVAGAQDLVLSLSNSNGKSGVIGYCSGGRQAVLSACNIAFNAIVDCYGAFVVEKPPSEFPLPITSIVDQIPKLSGTLLGLFGADDKYPSPDSVTKLGEILSEYGKDFDFHSFEGAGHAFFDSSRPSYRFDSANSGWALISKLFTEKLGDGS